MNYKKLDKSTVLDYISDVKSVMNYFGQDELQADEIGDGNLNYVYKITSLQDPKKALILKQAVPYLRCVGEEFPLGRERMNYEIRALQKFYAIFPSFVPKVHHANEDMSLVIMEYLDSHIIMRKGLLNKVEYKNFSEQMSTFMAATLFYTSSLHLSSSDKRALIDRFNSNVELCKLSEDLVFSFAFMEHETNINTKDDECAKKLFLDVEFKEKILELKYKFMTQNDALLHGDLHTGSIMINDSETCVIDPEFAFVGPFGFDIGVLLANLVSSYVYHSVVTKDDAYKEWLLLSIKEFLSKFQAKFLNFWSESASSALLVDGYLDNATIELYKVKFIKEIFRDSVGFAACELSRRVYGVAGVEEIRGIEDVNLRAEAEGIVLKIAREFLMSYKNIQNCDEILEIVKDAR
ncbi:MAG: S-methyl-5-thioribose kinase [Sulfurimonas sp.]|jgi:5-methylthioribose kinase|uniref:S-methyl-5-thioribose kinase n=1 Tax=Sulfurimonas sp. TaxID=2022749 RepID=UPI00261558CF|nr:S-methyl-5-thioribose kinase [Sulfurimonas sp.]MDD3475578.1 S-methyl-5-thioribose kinase [Sulfurimonas sp.]HUH41885.1 S-methyl-5-thioribose kinase [Sulfurimonas sp.]